MRGATPITACGNLDQTATIAAFLVHAPGESPAWHDYAFSVVHLRDITGQSRSAVRLFADATHEIIVCALDPNANPRAEDIESIRPLRPFNHTEQLALRSDDEARDLLTRLVAEVLTGRCYAEPPLSTGGRADQFISALTQRLLEQIRGASDEARERGRQRAIEDQTEEYELFPHLDMDVDVGGEG